MSLPLSSFVFRPSLVRKDLLPDTPALYAGVEEEGELGLDLSRAFSSEGDEVHGTLSFKRSDSLDQIDDNRIHFLEIA